ncbi:LOW QUALITY PROTEIN: bidirectional sugar transporter SWEET5-like [Actinidia eriantha]|uniref:LOW QUALITY PROTEIN: bidirectional sugar transporter SWEET5-like n=1 Tax=Actinidia eriantha TaxID=165200 RepID=UPI002591197A|nr:LOW QUALITY PROTEIN: bidirectional sugar transporter SWEET5-like [Actinidia eriantha]
MGDTETTRTIIGIIGNIISFFLFLSPLPTLIKIYKAKSVQEFKPDPYVATVLNCAMWVLYGLPFVHPDSLLVITINGTGLVIEFFYVAVFLTYSDWPKRKKIIIALVIEAIFFAIVAFITMTFLHTTQSRSMLIGILCVVFNIIMYTSPLTVMRMVITTKSVKYMPFYLSLANFCNGTIWLVYALLKFDPFITIPNGLGALSGAVQLIMYATYYKTTKWDDDEPSASDVQLSSKNNP